jgi:hypothetical protein
MLGIATSIQSSTDSSRESAIGPIRLFTGMSAPACYLQIGAVTSKDQENLVNDNDRWGDGATAICRLATSLEMADYAFGYNPSYGLHVQLDRRRRSKRWATRYFSSYFWVFVQSCGWILPQNKGKWSEQRQHAG